MVIYFNEWIQIILVASDYERGDPLGGTHDAVLYGEASVMIDAMLLGIYQGIKYGGTLDFDNGMIICTVDRIMCC